MSASTSGQDAYNRALAVYTVHLSAEERARLNAPTNISALISKAQTMGSTLGQSRKRASALRTFSDKAKQLEPFEILIAGACKLSPVAGELIWSSVTFILQLSKDKVKVFDEVLKFFETMADEVALFSLQETTFSTSPLVQSVVEALYCAILDFWAEALKYYRSRLGGPLARVKNLAFSSVINKKFEELRLHAVSIAQHNADFASFTDENRLQQQSAHQKRVKEWLNAPNYERDFRAATDLRYPGTCEWMRKKQAYIDWMSSTASPFLFVHGIPGAGKTVLSSWIISEARSAVTTDNIVLFHYFKDTDINKRTPESAIRSLIDQLLIHCRRTRDPLLSKIASALDEISFERNHHADYPDLWKVFSESVSSFILAKSSVHPPITVVLDAMDECESPRRLTHNLLDLAIQNVGKLKVFVTGRKSAWDSIKRSTSTTPTPVELEITLEDVHQDINAFVCHTITSIPRLSCHQHLRGRLSEEIGKPEKHQGMFLWAYLMCEEVERQGDMGALRRLLGNVPDGLDAMYRCICEGIAERDKGKGFSLSVLQWIINSPRPLKFSELQEGLRLMRPTKKATLTERFSDLQVRLMRGPTQNASLTPHSDWFDGASELVWSRQDIVDACGNLVTYTGLDKDDSFVLIHLSVTHFFRQNRVQPHAPPQENVRFLIEGVQNAKPTLGTLCLSYLLSSSLRSDEYLNSSTFKARPRLDYANFEIRHPLFQYAVMMWVEPVLTCLHSPGPMTPTSTELLTATVSFLSHPFATTWLEHFLHLSSVEDALDIFTQLAQVDISQSNRSQLADIAPLAGSVIRTLYAYQKTLSGHPELIRRCLGPIDSKKVAEKVTTPQVRTWQLAYDSIGTVGLPPLKAHTTPDWIHYQSENDILFSIHRRGLDSEFVLQSQITSTGVEGVPITCRGIQSGLRVEFIISPDKQFLAAITETFIDTAVLANNREVYLYCWRLPPNTCANSSTEEPKHTQQVVVNHAMSLDGMTTLFLSPNSIAFRGDGLLMTPIGIWDLSEGQKLPWLVTLKGLKPTSRRYDYLGEPKFSGDGEYVAFSIVRNDGIVLQVLNTRTGGSLCNSVFYKTDVEDFHLVTFSGSGKKIILIKIDKEESVTPSDPTGCLCFLTTSSSFITLQDPRGSSLDRWSEFPRFTSDEKTCVASLFICDRFESNTVVVWKITEDSDSGNHRNYVSISHLFRPAQAWCLALRTMAQSSTETDIIHVNSSGAITRQPLNQLPVWCQAAMYSWSHFTVTEILPERQALHMKIFFDSAEE
ncbi:hypothetical protein DXG01_012579 [Tephrocybe rancida]|nr:hypothetical protein DXG01_012579 [Tephrocybe rancida]